MANEFKIKKGLIVTGASGGTVVDIQGSQGQLFSVTDNLSGSIFAVSDISGVPILDVNSSGLVTVDGPFTQTGGGATILSGTLDVDGEVTIGSGEYLSWGTPGATAIEGSTVSNRMRFYTDSTLALTLESSQNATFAGDITTDGSLNINRLAGGTPYDNFKISTADIVTTLERVENTADAANGYGRLDFKTNATVNVTGAAGRGGYKFIDGDNNNILYLENLDKSATFGGQGFSAATSSGDASSTLTTKGYVDGLITGATIYRGAWQAGISATSSAATTASTTLTVTAAILDADGNTPVLVGAVVTGEGITGIVKVASVTSSTVYVLDTAITATATAYIFSPIYGAPDLSGVTETSGYYYICSEAGSATPNGANSEPNTWNVGDWCIYNDVSGTGQWQKIDNSSVLSGAGTGQTVALWEGPSSVTDSDTLGNAPITVSGNNSTFAGTINSGNIVVDNNGVPRLTLTDSGNGGGGGASGKITYSNTAGNAIALGYTPDLTTDSDFIISTDAGSTYGGYLGLDAAAIVDPSSIIIDPKTNVYITKAVGIGVKTPNDLLDIHNPATGAVDAQMNFTTAATGTGTSDGFRVGWNGAVAQMYLFEDADMRFATNNAEKMTITSAGGISFGSTGTAYGTSGQILKSNGNAAPTWIPQSDIVGAYLPLTGGTLTGNLNVQARVKAEGFFSHSGTYTANSYVNDWQKVYSHNWSTFSFSAFTIKVLAGGNTSNNNLNADVHINYKMQNGQYRVYANIVNYGSEALLAENFKINLSVTSAASGSWTIWHKLTSTYQTPMYTLIGSGIEGTWYSDTPVASPTGDDDTWTERIIINSMSVDVDNSANVGIGTTAPTSLLEISKQLSAASTIDYPYTISSRDDGNSINQAGGEGVGIKFRIAGNAATTPGDSLVGASIAAIRESASDTDSSTGLGLFVTQNDETLDEALRIDHDGNVGIGTDSPQSKLHIETGSGGTYNPNVNHDDVTIEGSGNIGLQLFSPATSYQYIAFGDPDSVNAGYLRYYHGTNAMVFRTNGSDNMVIDSSGDVGIGTTSPNVPLEIHGADIATTSTTTSTSVLRLVRDVVDPSFPNRKNSAVDFMLSRQQTVNNNLPYTRLDIRLAGTTDSSTPSLDVMSLLHNGNVGIGTTNPDSKLEVAGITTIKSPKPYGSEEAVLRIGVTSSGTNYSDGSFHNIVFGNEAVANSHIGEIQVVQGDPSVSTASDMRFFTNSGGGNTATGERMRITSGGNVGIGTGADVYGDLHLEGGQQDIVLTNTNADGVANLTISRIIGQARGYSNDGAAMQSIDFVTNATTWYKGDIVFKTNNTDGTDTSVAATEKMRIASNGNVGIGFTSPDSTPLSTTKLSVAGNTYVAGTLGIGATSPVSGLQISTNTTGDANRNTTTAGITLTRYISGTDYRGSSIFHAYQGISGSDKELLAFAVGPGNSNSPFDFAKTKMVITEAGNVGIGTTTPNAKLDIQGTQGQLFSVTDDLSGSIFAVADISGVPIFDVNSSGVSYFDGNVGIGTDNPNQLLHTLGGTVKVESDGGNAAGAILELKHANNNTTDVCATINFTNNIGGYAAIEGGTTGANNTGYLSFKTDNVGVQSEGIRVLGDGAIKLSQYTLTQQTGTSTYLLGVDASGNVVQSTNIPSGTGGGAGPYLPLSAGSNYPLTDTLYIKPSGSPTNTMLISARANDTYGNIQFTNAAETANWTQLRSTSTQFTINNANVGINVTSPGVKLQLVSADEQLTNFSSSVVDQLAYSQINASSSTSGVITGAAALELIGKANASGHGRHAWIGAEGTSDTTLLTKLKFKIRGQTASGYDWAGAAEAPTIMTLEGDGNVGIATTTPECKLHIVSTTTDNSKTLLLQNSSTGDASVMFNISGDTYSLGIDNSDSDKFKLSYGALGTNDRLVVDSSGNVSFSGRVAVGTTAAASNQLDVIGDIRGTKYLLNGNVSNPTSTTATIYDQASVGLTLSAHNLSIRNYNGSAMMESARFVHDNLTCVGDVIAYGSPSDIRLKENIKPIESALDKVIKLQGVTFDWKESDSILDIKEDIGFIAQDVQKVVPELVRENNNGMLSMRHQGITPILLEAIKELKAEIDLLKSKPCTCNKCNCNI